MSSGVCDTFDEIFRPNVTLSQTDRTVSAVCSGVILIWTSVNLVYFLLEKNKYARTRVRVGIFTINYYLAITFFVLGWMIPPAVGFENFPCWLGWASTGMTAAYLNATNFTRNSTFMLMTGLSFATQANGRISLDRIAEQEDLRNKMSTKQRLVEALGLIWYGLKFVFRPNAVKGKKGAEEHVQMLVALRFITSWIGSTLFTVAVLLPYIVIVIAVCLSVPTYRENCTGCASNSPANAYTVVGQGSILVPFAFLFNVKCLNLPDVFGVFLEEAMSAAWLSLAFVSALVISFANMENRYLLNILGLIGTCGGFFIASGLQILISRRQGHKVMVMGGRQRGNDKVSNDYVPTESSQAGALNEQRNVVLDIKDTCKQLKEILDSPVLSRLFEIYTLREFCDENLSFLHTVFEWKQAYSDIARNASSSRAKKIVNTYIRDGGLQQINISYNLASKMCKLADDPNSVFPETAFDEARIEVARMLEGGAISRFIRTAEYIGIVSNEAVVSAVTGGGAHVAESLDAGIGGVVNNASSAQHLRA